MTEISKAYLSGWEYNRLLQEDPVQPRTSALPTAALWQGAHQFWMFRAVLCTAESIENECAAADSVGWATGTIVRDLVADGIVESVDWSSLPHAVIVRLRQKQQQMRKAHPESEIRDRIARRDVAGLEMIKNELLQPVLEHYGAIASGAPNSLHTWAGSCAPSDTVTAEREVAGLLSTLAAPLLPGVQVCRPPGTGVPPKAIQAQRVIQNVVERPMITDLMAGDGRFAGPRGFVPYFEAVAVHADAYRPISEQILADWRNGRERLLRLRDTADKLLWSDLHEDWLPALTSQSMSNATFERLVSRAVAGGAFRRFLDGPPRQTVVGTISAAALAAISVGTGALAAGGGLNIVGAIGAMGAAAAAAEIAQRRREPAAKKGRQRSNLAIFYQQARLV